MLLLRTQKVDDWGHERRIRDLVPLQCFEEHDLQEETQVEVASGGGNAKAPPTGSNLGSETIVAPIDRAEILHNRSPYMW